MEAVVDVKSCVEPEEFKKATVEEEKELRDKQMYEQFPRELKEESVDEVQLGIG